MYNKVKFLERNLSTLDRIYVILKSQIAGMKCNSFEYTVVFFSPVNIFEFAESVKAGKEYHTQKFINVQYLSFILTLTVLV